jgi:hypothetical protein
MSVSQRGGIEALNAVRAHQGSDMQMEATKEGSNNTGAMDGAWSLDMSLKFLDLMYDGTGSAEFVPMTLSSASGNQQGVTTGVTRDTVLTQPSNKREAVSSSGWVSGVPDPPAMATGSVGDSQPVAAPPPGGNCYAPLADPGPTIPQKGSLAGIKMASALLGPELNRRL